VVAVGVEGSEDLFQEARNAKGQGQMEDEVPENGGLTGQRRVITTSSLGEEHDAAVIESYLTKTQNACLKEKNNGPASGVYTVFTSWEACWMGAER